MYILVPQTHRSYYLILISKDCLVPEQYSKVFVRETGKFKQVRIRPDLVDKISTRLIDRWQLLVDSFTRMMNVPTGLIMRLDENTIEVFISSRTGGNPYKKGIREELVYGLYCETVVGQQEKLLVPNAVNSPVWKDNNPDIKLNNISYLGFPVNWPSGEIFGTVCVLDNKENHYSEVNIDFLEQVKNSIEKDLELVWSNLSLMDMNDNLLEANSLKELLLDIITHDVITPASNILGFSNLLMEKYPDEEIPAYIHNSSKKLIDVMYMASSLARVSAGDDLDLSPVNIKKTVDEVITLLRPGIDQANMEIHNRLPENLVVNSNPIIAEIFTNYISNAIKHASEGRKIIIEQEILPDLLVVNVKDFGTTIPASQRENVFKRKVRLGKKTMSGNGLGLAIARRIALALNIETGVTPNSPSGNNFYVKFTGKFDSFVSGPGEDL